MAIEGQLKNAGDSITNMQIFAVAGPVSGQLCAPPSILPPAEFCRRMCLNSYNIAHQLDIGSIIQFASKIKLHSSTYLFPTSLPLRNDCAIRGLS